MFWRKPMAKKTNDLKKKYYVKAATDQLQNFINIDHIEIKQSKTFAKTIMMYIEKGANPNIKDKNGVPLLGMVITSFYNNKSFSIDDQLKIVQVLLDKGAYVNEVDNHGQTPITVAAAFNLSHLVELLIANGADLHIKTTSSHTTDEIAEIAGSKDSATVLESYHSKVKIP